MKVRELKALIPKEYRDRIYTIREYVFSQDEDYIERYHVFCKYGYFFNNGCGGSYVYHVSTIDQMISWARDIEKIDFDNDPVCWYEWMEDYDDGEYKYISKQEYIAMIKDEIKSYK